MSFVTRSTLVLASIFALTACGGDEDSGPKTKPIDDPTTLMQSKTTAENSAALTAIPTGDDANGGQTAIGQVGGSIQAFVGTYEAFKAKNLAGGPKSAQFALEALQQFQTAESYSFEDGHLEANITYDQAGTSLLYVIDMQLDTTEGGATLDGSFDLEFSTSAQAYDVAYDYAAQYDALTLQGGCAVGGSITIDYSFSVGGEVFNQVPADQRAQIADQLERSGRISATFGPECGDVSVEGS